MGLGSPGGLLSALLLRSLMAFTTGLGCGLWKERLSR
jgi:hypothetical protein